MTTEIIEKLSKYFNKHEEILFAVIFGSIAKGTANKMSDIDIAVMIDPDFNKPFPHLLSYKVLYRVHEEAMRKRWRELALRLSEDESRGNIRC